MKKQTAVQWLFEQYFEVKWGSMQGNMPTIFEQAKEMEKEQIIETYRSPVERAWNTDKIAEQYYKENYGDK
jgi:hypothetical protein